MASKGVKVWIAGLATAIAAVSCVSSGVDSYEEFESAVEAGAPCEELLDIRDGFDAGRERDRIDADLEEIGCDSRDAERNDQ